MARRATRHLHAQPRRFVAAIAVSSPSDRTGPTRADLACTLSQSCKTVAARLRNIRSPAFALLLRSVRRNKG
jgi:hypothetical protein